MWKSYRIWLHFLCTLCVLKHAHYNGHLSRSSADWIKEFKKYGCDTFKLNPLQRLQECGSLNVFILCQIVFVSFFFYLFWIKCFLVTAMLIFWPWHRSSLINPSITVLSLWNGQSALTVRDFFLLKERRKKQHLALTLNWPFNHFLVQEIDYSLTLTSGKCYRSIIYSKNM